MMDNKSELSKPVAYSLRFRNMNGEPDKTINANTTFSTLEKAKEYGLGNRYVTQDDGKIVCVRDPSQDPIVEPLYSQEYVSALLAEMEEERASREQWQQNCTRTEERIAELEAIRSDASQVFTEIGNELGCNPDNESIMMAIDDLKATQMTGPLKDVLKRNIELEIHNARLREWNAGLAQESCELQAKLATPVRLQSPWVDKVGNRWLLEGTTTDVIRAAGFKVEGDE